MTLERALGFIGKSTQIPAATKDWDETIASFHKLLNDYKIKNFSGFSIKNGSAIPGNHVFSVDQTHDAFNSFEVVVNEWNNLDDAFFKRKYIAHLHLSMTSSIAVVLTCTNGGC